MIYVCPILWPFSETANARIWTCESVIDRWTRLTTLLSFDSAPGNLAAETIVWSDHQLRACLSTDITSSHQALGLYEESIGVKEINHLSCLRFSRTALMPPESTLPLAASEKSNAAPIRKVAALPSYSLPHPTEESQNPNQLSEVKIKASRTQINPCPRLCAPQLAKFPP